MMAWALLGVLVLAEPIDNGTAQEPRKQAEAPAKMVVKGGENLEISAVRADFDRENELVLFDGGAKVDYSAGYHLESDRIFVFFAGSNDVDRIVALGNVSVSNANRRGYCDNAVLRRWSREVEMLGGDGKLARLEEAGSSEVVGRRIRFWFDSEQVEIDGSELVFAKSDVKREDKEEKTDE